MSRELLEQVAATLPAAGFRTGEEYPGREQPFLASPMAAVGLGELDPGQGRAVFQVRVLSPRVLGGWRCQTEAARAAESLWQAGYSSRTGALEYLGDCFCVTVTAVLALVPGSREPLKRQFLCGDVLQEGVISFRAARDLGRRLVGAHWENMPVGVTPGQGGWRLELVQRLDRAPEEPEEPFVLTVREGDRAHRYTGCCWNETVWEYDGAQKLTRRGFALDREEDPNG